MQLKTRAKNHKPVRVFDYLILNLFSKISAISDTHCLFHYPVKSMAWSWSGREEAVESQVRKLTSALLEST